MFLRRPQLPVTMEQAEWLDKSFALLEGLFGVDWVRRAPLVLPNDQFFPQKWEPTEAWAGFAFGRVCELMWVPRDRVQLALVEDPWAALRESGVPLGETRDAAGRYRELRPESGNLAEIEIKHTLLQEPERMVAVMAHELAHVLLLGDGKIDRSMERMEPLTDLMTVFCGFGVFNANAAHVHETGSRGWRVAQTGYLSPREYAYSLALFAWKRGEPNPSWDRELTKNVRVFMRDALRYFETSKRPV